MQQITRAILFRHFSKKSFKSLIFTLCYKNYKLIVLTFERLGNDFKIIFTPHLEISTPKFPSYSVILLKYSFPNRIPFKRFVRVRWWNLKLRKATIQFNKVVEWLLEILPARNEIPGD